MTAAVGLMALAMMAQMILMFRAARARFACVGARRVRLSEIALDSRAWPDDVLKLSNNMNNQFETPTLFYGLVLLALVLELASLPLAILAWAYVALRVAHRAVHTGANHLPTRPKVFMLGVSCLMIMAIILVIEIAVGMLAS
ncbi:MAPEG family protein [Hartmannibacter diazotrophicus]|uniref:MAPEG family protein n=1 Tax=Hartmannibacter diazotrophicus TaxID=1482074 RepID=A0A2C9D6M6_9HYPH|nr:MAPEG family protein [Hartmannibacter diazotrophicus]SON55165.1 MAPEG family protein [Hartmannibacter diazotrophicus]